MPSFTALAAKYELFSEAVNNPDNGRTDTSSDTYADGYGFGGANMIKYYGFDFPITTLSENIFVNSVRFKIKVKTENDITMESYVSYYINDSRAAGRTFKTSSITTYTDTNTSITREDLVNDPDKNYVIFAHPLAEYSKIYVYGIEITVDYTVLTITANAGANGSINPNGTINATCGGSQTYTITPNSGYAIDTLIVDGVSVTPTSTYVFNNITAAHTITATFKLAFDPAIIAAKKREWFFRGR